MRDAVIVSFLDSPPKSDALTDYDRAHLVHYLQILDAEADGADWRYVVRVVFELEPNDNLKRAKLIHASHLARAKWMTETGYRLLLLEGKH
jgi:hypothetical protein